MTTLTQRAPDTFDTAIEAHRPMTPGVDVVMTNMIPLSSRNGNTIVSLGDGLYSGNAYVQPAFYVSSAGSNTNPGTEVAPFATLDYAITTALAQSQSGASITGSIAIALQAGQTFTQSLDVVVGPGGKFTLTFFGDPQYGDYNGAPIGSGADPAVMTDLARPIVNPVVSQVDAQWKMAGITCTGGDVSLIGVSIQLPAAPSNPNIAEYSTECDYVRTIEDSDSTAVKLTGSIINCTDTTSYWGFLGLCARTRPAVLMQFASQFQVNGTLLTSSAATNAQLLQRPYFIKFFSDYAGNNQQTGTIAPTSGNSSPGSAILNLMWSDTESLPVEAGKTNQASFPVLFDINYGFRNYVLGLQFNQFNAPINVLSSRIL